MVLRLSRCSVPGCYHGSTATYRIHRAGYSHTIRTTRNGNEDRETRNTRERTRERDTERDQKETGRQIEAKRKGDRERP